MIDHKQIDKQIDLKQTNHTSTNGARSTIQLVKDMADDTRLLARQEIQLAKTEIVEAITARVKMAGTFAAAGVFALLGLIFLTVAAVAGLATVMPIWLSALIFALVFMIAGSVAVVLGKSHAGTTSIVPEQAVRTVKEDVEWARTQLKR